MSTRSFCFGWASTFVNLKIIALNKYNSLMPAPALVWQSGNQKMSWPVCNLFFLPG